MYSPRFVAFTHPGPIDAGTLSLIDDAGASVAGATFVPPTPVGTTYTLEFEAYALTPAQQPSLAGIALRARVVVSSGGVSSFAGDSAPFTFIEKLPSPVVTVHD